jgi:hypothetical protein
MSEEKSQATTETPAVGTEVPTPAPASSEAAQEALRASDPTLLTEKPAEAPIFDAAKIVVPEGTTIDAERLGAFAEIAKGLPHETAQKLVDFYVSAQRAESEKSLGFWKTTRDGWEKEVREDKEIGGANLEKVLQTVGKVLDNPQLTDPKFREALEFTGIGSHPAAVRTLYKWRRG